MLGDEGLLISTGTTRKYWCMAQSGIPIPEATPRSDDSLIPPPLLAAKLHELAEMFAGSPAGVIITSAEHYITEYIKIQAIVMNASHI